MVANQRTQTCLFESLTSEERRSRRSRRTSKEVRVVVGADGLKTLLPEGLLGDGSGEVEPKPGE
jgi:hypothetical protein